MTEQPTQEETDRWQRRFAVACNNGAWDLISQDERTAAQGREMLYMAYAAAYHWSKVGTPLNHARAEVTLAHALSMLGKGADAMDYALSALAFFDSGQGEDWDLAYGHLEVALAAAVLGDQELYHFHAEKARSLGEAIQEDEDREVVLQELARLPLL